MGNSSSSPIKKANFEDISDMNKSHILISTLPEHEQCILISHTIQAEHETRIVEEAIKERKSIIVYGKNSNDESIYKKCEQIASLGHTNVFVYPGGLFEWLLLQDIFGEDAFPTTKKTDDLLSYKPHSHVQLKYLEN
jgi:hypothetical protein